MVVRDRWVPAISGELNTSATGTDEVVLFDPTATTPTERLLFEGSPGAIAEAAQIRARLQASTLSPDGRYLTYVANPREESTFDLFLVDLEAEEPTASNITELPEGGEVGTFAWSPDSLHLAVHYTEDGSVPVYAQLFSVEPGGSVTRTSVYGPGDGTGRGAGATAHERWSADSTLYFLTIDAEDVVPEAYVFDVTAPSDDSAPASRRFETISRITGLTVCRCRLHRLPTKRETYKGLYSLWDSAGALGSRGRTGSPGTASKTMNEPEEEERSEAPGPPEPLDRGIDPPESTSEQPEEVEDIQAQAEKAEAEEPTKFGTFAGVFTPTLLTILGVIMYLREGWVVGNAGLGGAILIISLSFGITAATGLSMSSFVTNIRIGAGGAFSMISQSLGLEAGGAIGVPLYISQALAVVMYIFGFREGYLWAVDAWGLPALAPLVIDLLVLAVVFGITMVSTALAFKVQYVILAIIIASLVSIGAAAIQGPMDNPIVWWGDFRGSPEDDFSGTSFWVVFAVFFPASTGIMAGANMSGDLKNPRKSIPRGMLSAIGLSLVVYLALAYWLMRSASVDELTGNYTIMIDRAFWGPAVLAGLLAATFSSALASFVGAPRILQALASHSIVPWSPAFAKRTTKGEPRNATFLTAAIVVCAIMLRELNAIAPLIAMIFLLSYATINLVVSVEQRLGLLSFRPLMRVPRIIPLLGLAGCVFAMFIINAIFSLVALALVVVIYFMLMHKRLTAPTGGVRSGLFTATAEWAARKVKLAQGTSERAWKPNILLPVEDPNRLQGSFEVVEHLAHPMGSVNLLGLAPAEGVDGLRKKLLDAQQALTDSGVFTSSTVMESDHFPDDVRAGMQAMAGSFFRPNLLFMELPKNENMHASLQKLIEESGKQRMGVALLVQHELAGLGRRRRINLWLPDQGPEWKVEMEFANLDLAILLAYRMMDSWDAKLTVIATVDEEDEATQAKAQKFLERLVNLARLPAEIEVHVATGDFDRYAETAPEADLNVFPLPKELDAAYLWSLRDATGSSCLFTRDGGDESALS